MNSKINYHQYLKRWKSQLNLFADLMNCSLIVASELPLNQFVALAYSHPKENSILKNCSTQDSLIKSTIKEQHSFSISDLQSQKKYNSYIEITENLKCFYSFPLYTKNGSIFGALCMYSREVSFLEKEKMIYLNKIKSIIEDDLLNENRPIPIQAIPHKTLLRENEIFRQFFHYSPVGIFLFDTNLVITDLNEKFSQILKLNREALLGLDVNLIHDKRVIPTLKSALLGAEDEYEGGYITTTGNSETYILLKSAPVYNDNNKICGGIGIIQDLTLSFQIENALKESELKYKDLVEKINEVIFSTNQEGICTYTSPVISLLIGYSPNEIIGHHFLNFVNENHKITFFDALNKVAEGANVVSEVKLRDKDGSFHWARVSMRPIYNENGEYTGVHGVVQDIEETRIAEQSLRDSEEQFRLVATQISDIIFEWNPMDDQLIWHGKPEIISPKLNKINTLNKLLKLIPEDERSIIKKNWEDSINKRTSWKSEFKITSVNNEIKYVLGNGIMLFKGEVAYKGFGTLNDITNEKTLIKNLKKSNDKLEENITKVNGLLSAIPDMMFVFDKKGCIKDYHTNDESILFKDENSFLNHKIDQVLPSAIAELTIDKIQLVLKTQIAETYKYELQIKGGTLTFESRMVYLNKNHTLAIVRDITSQEKAKQDLIRAKEKAEESDRLKSSFLANMSHEIRTPMNGIIGFSELLKGKTLNPYEREYYTSVIVKSGHQLLDIINDVLEISKIETGQISVHNEDVNINKLIKTLVAFFKNKAEERNNELIINTPLTDNDSVIYSDINKLRQIFTNLISNAIKFTQNGTVTIGYSLQKEKFIEFYVEDTGIGIATDEQKKIFERFTQANIQISRKHGGTGLGLSISQSLTEMLGGKIWLESELNKGAKFFFSVPVSVSKVH